MLSARSRFCPWTTSARPRRAIPVEVYSPPSAPNPREGQKIAWVKPLEMAAFPMPPADEPLIARLAAYTENSYA